MDNFFNKALQIIKTDYFAESEAISTRLGGTRSGQIQAIAFRGVPLNYVHDITEILRPFARLTANIKSNQETGDLYFTAESPIITEAAARRLSMGIDMLLLPNIFYAESKAAMTMLKRKMLQMGTVVVINHKNGYTRQ